MALIHRWPLTENANDVVGGLNMTNNGGVTFSSEGALINSTSKNLAFTRSAFRPSTISIWVKGTLVHQLFGAQAPMDNGYTVFFYLNRIYFVPIHSATVVSIAQASPVEEWAHVVGVATSDTITIYLNNVAGGSALLSGVTSLTNFGVNGAGAGAGPMNIMDIRWFDHALSESEVLALYTAGPNVIVDSISRHSVPTPVVLSTMPGTLTRGFR